MDRYRRNCLIVSITAFAAGLALLLITLVLSVGTVRADEIEYHVAGYVAASLAYDTGYDPGIGGIAEAYARWKFLELKGHGNFVCQHKKSAQSGYTYRYGVEGRGYVYGPFYLSAASRWAGYKSEFESGAVWEKEGRNTGFGIGYNNGDTDIALQYFLKETASPNNVQFWRISARQRIWKWLWAMTDIYRQSWDQIVNGEAERWAGWTGTVGLGVRW